MSEFDETEAWLKAQGLRLQVYSVTSATVGSVDTSVVYECKVVVAEQVAGRKWVVPTGTGDTPLGAIAHALAQARVHQAELEASLLVKGSPEP